MDNASAGLGIGLILLFLLVGLVATVFCIWAVVDAVKRPDHEWAAAGQNKVVWLVVLLGSWFVGFALIAALVYWFWPRPALIRAQGGVGGPQAGYGGY
jgi:protein-S-isoprenylcysteine O-methyltransferase Ste14